MNHLAHVHKELVPLPERGFGLKLPAQLLHDDAVKPPLLLKMLLLLSRLPSSQGTEKALLFFESLEFLQTIQKPCKSPPLSRVL